MLGSRYPLHPLPQSLCVAEFSTGVTMISTSAYSTGGNRREGDSQRGMNVGTPLNRALPVCSSSSPSYTTRCFFLDSSARPTCCTVASPGRARNRWGLAPVLPPILWTVELPRHKDGGGWNPSSPEVGEDFSSRALPGFRVSPSP